MGMRLCGVKRQLLLKRKKDSVVSNSLILLAEADQSYLDAADLYATNFSPDPYRASIHG